MKKLLLISALFLVAATGNVAMAQKKHKKVDAKTEATTVAAKPLTTPSDSISYAAGLASVEGLDRFLQEVNVDSAHIEDFIRGYKAYIAAQGDPAAMAYAAGQQIAMNTYFRVVPSLSKEVAGTPDSINAQRFHEGFVAGVRNDTTYFKPQPAAQLVMTRIAAIRTTHQLAYKKQNEDWLTENAKKPGVVTTQSGLQYKVLKAGDGQKPKETDRVRVVYEGRTIDGQVFDATANHGGRKYDIFACNQVIKGWTEALTSMPVGSKWEIYIPQGLAYGDRPAGSIQPFSTLIFDVELVGIEAPKTTEAKPAEKKPAAKTVTKKGKK